jgi:hypothetical protein
VRQGYVIAIPDSFSTRGHAGGVCVDPSPTRNEVSPLRRVPDAYEALAYLYERKVLARARSVRSTCVRPVFVSGSTVVVRWVFEFDWLDGRKTRMEELAYQRWEGERIAEEQFFYDPAQLAPAEPKP